MSNEYDLQIQAKKPNQQIKFTTELWLYYAIKTTIEAALPS